MGDMNKLCANLERRGFLVQHFTTGAEAVQYLQDRLVGRTIGVGGSMTIEALELRTKLAECNTVLCHWAGVETLTVATTEVYLSSCNAVAETGELVNIDGVGNRVASTIFGHQEVYFLVGANKITPNLDAAVFRARNVAAPRNAARLGKRTPCVGEAAHCHDCASPERICRTLAVHFAPPSGVARTEIILIDEHLGY